MESALYGVYTLVVLYQKSNKWAKRTSEISDTPQLVCKHPTRALSIYYDRHIKNLKYVSGYMGYRQSASSRWSDIGQAFICVLMDRDGIEVHKLAKKERG